MRPNYKLANYDDLAQDHQLLIDRLGIEHDDHDKIYAILVFSQGLIKKAGALAMKSIADEFDTEDEDMFVW